MSLTVSSWDIWENMVAQMISSLNFLSERQFESSEVYRKGFETKNEGVGTLWLTKCLCHLGTGI